MSIIIHIIEYVIVNVNDFHLLLGVCCCSAEGLGDG